MKLMRMLTAIFAILLLTWGCYYDHEEVLYPATACDTTNITFSQTIKPIFGSQCTQCHNSVSPSANYDLSNYDGVVACVNAGRILGAINHLTGYSPMPKNGNQLPSCQITQITIWINAGMPNN
jgi:hypothetical protein